MEIHFSILYVIVTEGKAAQAFYVTEHVGFITRQQPRGHYGKSVMLPLQTYIKSLTYCRIC